MKVAGKSNQFKFCFLIALPNEGLSYKLHKVHTPIQCVAQLNRFNTINMQYWKNIQIDCVWTVLSVDETIFFPKPHVSNPWIQLPVRYTGILTLNGPKVRLLPGMCSWELSLRSKRGKKLSVVMRSKCRLAPR